MFLKTIFAALLGATLVTQAAVGGEVLCCSAGACIPWPDPPEECQGEIIDLSQSGACCHNNGGTCTSPIGQEACEATGGEYLGNGSDCGSPALGCVLGETDFPCCMGDECSIMSANDCLFGGGRPYIESGADCGDIDCAGSPPLLGGCCGTADGCTNGVTADDCDLLGGEFLGIGFACGPNICEAITERNCCCANGQCFETSPAQCAAAGGISVMEVGQSCTCSVGGTAACDSPIIIHGKPIAGDNEPPEETEPFTGFIDPRAESTNGVQVDLGATYTDVAFSQPVQGNPIGGPLTVDNFAISQTGGEAAPNIISVEKIDALVYRVTWDRPVSTKEWTTIKVVANSTFGTPVLNLGSLGPQNEPDRIDIAALPGDVNQDGSVTPFDLLQFRQGINGIWLPEVGVIENYLDIDRSGDIGPFDLLKLRQLILGVGDSTETWNGAEMNSARP